MTTRRLPHTAASPSLTSGDDRPAGACHAPYREWKRRRDEGLSDDPWVFDELIEHKGGTTRSNALREARAMCLGGCPLAATCLPANRDEKWAQDVMDITHTGRPRHGVNAAKSEGALRKHRLNREARAESLRALVARGATVEEACDELSVSYHALYKWTDKWGHEALWSALVGRSVAA